jgi:hypothetical protein
VNDEKAGDVIQLQGDQRNSIKDFLIDKEKGLDIDAKTIKVSPYSDNTTETKANSCTGPWLLIASPTAPPATPARGNGFGQIGMLRQVFTTITSPESFSSRRDGRVTHWNVQ